MKSHSLRFLWVFLFVVLAACSAKHAPDRGGLMLIVKQEPGLELDKIHIEVTANDKVLRGSDYRLPAEATLPTTLAIVSNGDPALVVNIAVIGWKGTTPVDRRDSIVMGVPVDRVVAHTVVLSGRCTSQVVTATGGAVSSKCGAAKTCDPASGDCASSSVDAMKLPPYANGQEHQPARDGGVSDVSAGDALRDASPDALTCPEGQKVCGGLCVSIDDPNYGCGVTTCSKDACPPPDDGTLVCQGSTCAVGSCGAGTKKCGGACVNLEDPKYGCTTTSCDTTACPKATGATLACQGGVCALSACPAGAKKCGDKCVSIDDPDYGCGPTTCDKSSCPAAGTATLACQAGACVIGTCGAGTKKCGGKCVAIDDPTYGCGATTCDAAACPAAGTGTLVCAAGQCVIGNCGAGTKKCGNKCVPTDVNNGCADPAVCTACGATESCAGNPTVCKCVPDNVEACKNKACGTAVNNCGQTVQCPNTCASPNTCGGGGAGPNGCGCTANNAAACVGKACGSTINNCVQTVTCPNTCTSPNTCGGGGAGPNGCGCTANNAAACAGKACGPATNNCGTAITCANTCTGAKTCNGDGSNANACSYPTPPSCTPVGDGRTNCGVGGNENCCASPLVTGNEFSIGYTAGSGGPQTKVTVSTFRLDKFEVTVGRYRRFVDAVLAMYRPGQDSGKHTHLAPNGLSAIGGGNEPGWKTTWNTNLYATKTAWDKQLRCQSNWQTWSPEAGADERRPIVCVNMYQAQAFCIWDGGFLPSYAEWNYAATGGDQQRYYPWSQPATSTVVDLTYAAYNCNGGACSTTRAVEVGTKTNGVGRFGQMEMSGNVDEMVIDAAGGGNVACTDCARFGADLDPRMRAGGHFVAGPDPTSSADAVAFDLHEGYIGFRCARAP